VDAASASNQRIVALFVRMWAVAHIVHLAGFTDGRLDTPWNVVVFVAALALVHDPTRGRWLLILIAAQLVDLVVELPFSPDHWILAGVVNLAILATIAMRRHTGLATIAAAFPAARAALLVGYGAAALAKYNTTFLDPDRSCATAIANVASFGVVDAVGVPWMWLWATIVCESAIFVLLVVPRSRRHGVRLGMAFHFLLSASPAFAVVDFTTALFALFFLFLPEAEAVGVLDRLASWGARSAIVRDARRAPWAFLAAALLAFGVLGWMSIPAASGVLYVASELYVIVLLVAALSTWRRGEAAPAPRSFGRLRLAHLPVIALIALWAANPYLGLRTGSVFTMFSGLRTEGTDPNHLFLPAARLTDWQDELVVVTSVSDPDNDLEADQLVGIPLLGLRRMLEESPRLTVTAQIDGEEVTFGRGRGHVRLEPLPPWQHKLLFFRPVGLGDERFCHIS
jgi:hypothetical protein